MDTPKYDSYTQEQREAVDLVVAMQSTWLKAEGMKVEDNGGFVQQARERVNPDDALALVRLYKDFESSIGTSRDVREDPASRFLRTLGEARDRRSIIHYKSYLAERSGTSKTPASGRGA